MKLEIKELTKTFGSFTANDRIDLTFEEAEIHCLLGENGAGKSTLMNMLYGLLDPSSGEILVDGQPSAFVSPRDAIAAGIGMVHQHFMLVPVFTVAENVMLGRERTRGLGVLNRKAAADLVRDLSERFNLAVDPDALIEDLPVGVQQRVEILKALSNDAKVLILDEPTAVLTPQEIDELMDIMRGLKAQGTSIIFITHKLREVKAVGDKISVIRRGKLVGTAPPSTSEAQLAEMMVGRAVKLKVDKDPPNVGATVLDVRGVTVVDPRGHQAVKGCLVRGARRRGPRHRRSARKRPDRTDQVPPRPDRAGCRRGLPRRQRHRQVTVPGRVSRPGSATSPRIAPTMGTSARSVCARTWCWISIETTNSPRV